MEDYSNAPDLEEASSPNFGDEFESTDFTKSGLDDYFDSFVDAEDDPFGGVRRLSSKKSLTGISLTQNIGAPFIPELVNKYRGGSVADYYGRRLYASRDTYNAATNRDLFNVSSNYRTILDAPSPRGLVVRPSEKDYVTTFNKLLDKPNKSFKGTYYQFQETSVVSNLLSQPGSVQLLMQGVNPETDAKDVKVVGKNEITKSAFDARQKARGGDPEVNPDVRTIAFSEGALHPKIGYFKEGDNVTGFIFGGQNITSALPKNNTLEEVFFGVGINLNSKDGKSGALTKQVVDVVDTLHEIAATYNSRNTSVDIVEFREKVFDTFNKKLGVLSKAERQYVFVNEDIHKKMSQRVRAAADNRKERVVLNIQYLENIFRAPSADMSKHEGFMKFRSDMLTSMAELARDNRLVIATSNTSVDSKQGLFKLITDMGRVDVNALDRVINDRTASLEDRRRAQQSKLGFDTFNLLISKGSFSVQPIQFMHSKSAAFLNEQGVGDTFLTTANYSHNSFAKNVELGLFLTKDVRTAMGLADQEEQLDTYFRHGLNNHLNTGLFVERRGKADKVEETIRFLERIGGQELGTGEEPSGQRFTFIRRYTEFQKEGGGNYMRLTGLDIRMQDKMTFSVTISSVNNYITNKDTGLTEKVDTPVIYLNRGNRIMTSAAYKYKGDRNLQVTGFNGREGDALIRPGESVTLNANDMLAGLIQTLELSYEFERNQKTLLHSLVFLDSRYKKGNVGGLDYAIMRLQNIGDAEPTTVDEARSLEHAARMSTTLRKIIDEKDVVALAEHSEYATRLVKSLSESEAYYNRTINEAKSAILAQVIDVLTQPHEGPYSHYQLLENLPAYGVAHENLQLLSRQYRDGNASKGLELKGLILSQVSLRHEDTIMVGGRAAIRGVADQSRPESVSPENMTGGLHKAREGAPKVKNANFLNKTPGLRLMTVGEYKQNLTKSLADKSDSIYAASIKDGETALTADDKDYEEAVNKAVQKIVTQYTEQVFSLYRDKEMGGNQESELPNNAVVYFFPYPKTEQISQRLKNTQSVRPFVYGTKEFTKYLQSFGYRKDNNFNFKNPDKIVGARFLSGLGDTQFREVLDMLEESRAIGADGKRTGGWNVSSVLTKLREASLNSDEPRQGFLGEERNVLITGGATPQNDFSYINSNSFKNRGFIFAHRQQKPINFADISGSVESFNQKLAEKVKPGTLFVAKELFLGSFGEGGKDFVTYVIKNRLAAEIQKLHPQVKGFNVERKEDRSLVEEAFKSLKKKADASEMGYQWTKSVKLYHKGEFNPTLKAGVYSPSGDGKGYDLKSIGGINQDGNSFYIDGIYTARNTNAGDKPQLLSMRAPAFARREEKGVSIITDISIGHIDGQPNMMSVNVNYLTELGIVAGLRGSTVKGPLLPFAPEFFKRVNDIGRADSEIQPERQKLRVNAEEVFAIIGAGQMKGMVFNMGNALLRGIDGGSNKVYDVVKGDKGGKLVAEALATIMMGDKEVRDAMLDFYGKETELAKSKSQFISVLESHKKSGLKLGKDFVTDKDTKTLSGSFSSTLAVYEGLVGLIDPKYLEDGMQGLKQTVIDVLRGVKGAEGRLQQATQSMFDEMYGGALGTEEQGVTDKGFFYSPTESKKEFIGNETTNRSAALMAFFLKAHEDLLTDIDPRQRLGMQSITELGYVNYERNLSGSADVRKDTLANIESLLVDYAKGDADKLKDLKTKKAELEANSINFDVFKQFVIKKTGNTKVLKNTREKYLEDKDIQHRYQEAARALGIKLPTAEEYQQIDNKYSDLAQAKLGEIDLALYAIYATGQTGKYMEAEVDIGISRIMPATGMQDTTELEGHYAAKLTQAQLDLYTKGSKDAKSFSNIQQAVITLGALVENAYGYLSQGKVRSSYLLSEMSVLELGLSYENLMPEQRRIGDYNLFEIDDEGKLTRSSELEQDRIASMRMSLMFSQAYTRMTEKGMPRILSGKNDVGIINVAPAFELFKDFSNNYGIEATNAEDTLKERVNYMQHLKHLTTGTVDGQSDDIRVDYLIDDYLNKLVTTGDNKINPVKTQAEQLVSDLIRLKNSEKEISGYLKGDKNKELVDALRRDIQLLTDEADGAEIDKIKEKIQDTLKGNLKPNTAAAENLDQSLELAKQIVSINDMSESEYTKISQMTSRAAIREALRDKTNDERQQLLRHALAASYSMDKEVTKESMTEIVKSAIESAEKANSLTDKFDATDTALKQNSIIFEMLRSIIGKNFEDKIKASIQLDPGKEYLLGRQTLRAYAQTTYNELDKDLAFIGPRVNQEAVTKADQDRRQSQMLKQLEQNVGRTQMIAIPYLDLDDQIGDDGRYKFRVSSASPEQGVLMGLDLLENVALIFPDFSSRALQAQFNLVKALYKAEESGLLRHITNSISSAEGTISSAQAIEMKELRKVAQESRAATLELVDNQKTMRNAMGEQLGMKGASYIGMSSMLLKANEIATGSRFDNLLDIGNAGLDRTLKQLYNVINDSSAGIKDELKIQALDEVRYIQSLSTGTSIQGAATKADLTDFQDKLQSGIRNEAERMLTAMGMQSDESYRRTLEQKWFANNILTGRQGAPAWTGAGFAEGKDRVTVEQMIFSSKNAFSLMALDADANSTVMLMSSLGTQFTQLGDYDGDSFQVAITRMAEVTAELNTAWVELMDAKRLKTKYSQRQERAREAGDTSLDDLPIVTDALDYNYAQAESNLQLAATTFAAKVQTLNELQRKSAELGKQKIREYGTQFLGLPAVMFQNDKDSAWAIGAILDTEIGGLFKQHRDTISGLYDNREHFNNWMVNFIAKTEYGATGWTFADDSKADERALFLEFVEQYNKEDNQRWNALDLNDKKWKYDLIGYNQALGNTKVGLATINKIIEKAMGTQITETALREVQAIIGVTGTGLLGKTYNTVIPLMALAAGEVAMTNVVNTKEHELKKLFTAAFNALDITSQASEGTSASISGPSEFMQGLRALVAPTSNYQTISSLGDSRSSLNATMGVMMNIQQFLRDAALKPKEKTSVGEVASNFTVSKETYSNLADSEGNMPVGLANLLDAAKDNDTQKSAIIQEFITKKVGYQLAADFGVSTTNYKQQVDIDANEMRAFSVLEMMNEYLSGKFTADQMIETSGFSELLQGIKDKEIAKAKEEEERTGTLRVVTNKEIVQKTIVESLTRFRTEFIYGSVLEGDKIGDILSTYSKRMEVGYEEENIENRVKAYRDYKIRLSQIAAAGGLMSPEDINMRVKTVMSNYVDTPEQIEAAAVARNLITTARDNEVDSINERLDAEIAVIKNERKARLNAIREQYSSQYKAYAASLKAARSTYLKNKELVEANVNIELEGSFDALRQAVPNVVIPSFKSRSETALREMYKAAIATPEGREALSTIVDVDEKQAEIERRKEKWADGSLKVWHKDRNNNEKEVTRDEYIKRVKNKKLSAEELNAKADNYITVALDKLVTVDMLEAHYMTFKSDIDAVDEQFKLEKAALKQTIEPIQNQQREDTQRVYEEFKPRLIETNATYQTEKDAMFLVRNTELGDLNKQQLAATEQRRTNAGNAENLRLTQTNENITATPLTDMSQIELDVKRFEADEIERAGVIKSAVAGLSDKDQEDPSKRAQAIFKAVIFHNIAKEHESLPGDSLDNLISINKVISDIRSGEGLISGKQGKGMNASLDIMSAAFTSLMGRGKLDAGVIAESTNTLLDLALQIGKGDKARTITDSAAALGILDGVVKGVGSLIKTEAEKKATAEVDASRDARIEVLRADRKNKGVDINKLEKQQASVLQQQIQEKYQMQFTEELVNLLTTKVESGGKETTIAEYVASEVSSTAKAKEMQDSVRVLTQMRSDALLDGDDTQVQMLTHKLDEVKRTGVANFSFQNMANDVLYKELKRRDSEEIKGIERKHLQLAKAKAKKEYGGGMLASLVAVPVLFGLAQGDVTFNDRVAMTFSDILQSAISTTSFEDSAIRQVLAGRDPEKSKSRAEERSEQAAVKLQQIRVTESMRRSYSKTEGLMTGASFEIMMRASAMASNKLASAVGRLPMFRGNTTAQVLTEVISGVAGMAIANVQSKRIIPGTYSTYDDQWAMTMKIMESIKNNMLLTEQAIINAQVNIGDGSEDQASIDSYLGEGDFEFNEPNTSMSYAQRFFYQSTLEETAELEVVEESNV